MGYGLALAGGGTRGAAHAGVLLALEEEHLLPEAIGGTSAGSIVAGCFACGMRPQELCETVRILGTCGMEYLDPDLWGLITLIPQMILGRKMTLTGLLRGRRLNRLFCDLTKEQRLEQISFPLLIPAVDLQSGSTVCFTNMRQAFKMTDKRYGMGESTSGNRNSERVTGEPGGEQTVHWVESGRVCDIMTASSSVPGVFRPFKTNGFCLVDGGVTNNLPVDLMKEAGVRTIVAVDVGADYEMPEDDSIFEILSHSYSIMSSNLKDCRSMGETYLLRPQLTKKAGLLTFEHMETCMEEAYRCTKENAGHIREAIAR